MDHPLYLVGNNLFIWRVNKLEIKSKNMFENVRECARGGQSRVATRLN